MNYELTKQLKDAGFPQEAVPERGSFYALPVGYYTHMLEEWRKDLIQPEIPCRIPTLEEIIEACGDKFSSLLNEHGSWRVYGIKVGFSGLQITTKGATPTEAMANFYIALNK